MGALTRGTTFVDGGSYHGTDLNNLVDNATANAALITGQTTASPATTDSLLFYDLSGTALAQNTVANVLDLQLKDAAANVASMRTLGTGSSQAAQGNLVPYLASSNIFTGAAQQIKHVKGTIGVTVAANAGLGVGGTATLATGSADLFG